ncbi:MAG: hypothetical protein ACT4PK_07545 [Gammaproteobacteria bacterium]
MQNRARIAVVVLAAAAAPILEGCSSITTYRLYPGERAQNEVAVVIWDGGDALRLVAVDGVPVPQAKLVLSRAELLPGRRTLSLRALALPREEGGRQFGHNVFRVVTLVEAGRCYMVHQDVKITSREGSYYLGEETIRGTIAEPELITAAWGYDRFCDKREPAVTLTAKP